MEPAPEQTQPSVEVRLLDRELHITHVINRLCTPSVRTREMVEKFVRSLWFRVQDTTPVLAGQQTIIRTGGKPIETQTLQEWAMGIGERLTRPQHVDVDLRFPFNVTTQYISPPQISPMMAQQDVDAILAGVAIRHPKSRRTEIYDPETKMWYEIPHPGF